jgi:intron-binding protein aquarius
MLIDVNHIHLLRLGHGEEELDSEQSFGKVGRINSLMDKRLELLAEVEKIALSLSVPSDYAYSCETATYFFLREIHSRWENFCKTTNDQKETFNVDEFPFTNYFSTVKPDLFPSDKSAAQHYLIATECFEYLQDVFNQLNDMRVYELLQSNKERSHYLLSREARITAMTSMHAALKHKELCELDFSYDTIIMEEAGQIMEIEAFIPLVLQKMESRNKLKRIVMIGDHNQLPPVVSNFGLQKYGNLQQSMFTRLIRMGVPTIQLSDQVSFLL